MSHGAFIPPMVCAWCMHGPFVEQACIPGHSHGLQNHPGGPQDDGTMPSSHHAQLPPSVPPPPLLSSPSSPSCTRCMPKCMPSTSHRAWQHNIIHIMNSSGGAHKTRRSGGVHLCHQHHVPLPTQTLSPFAPAHPSHHAHHADQPAPANACSSMTPRQSPPPTCLSHLATLRTAAFALSVPHSMHPTMSPGCTTYPRPHSDVPDPQQRPSTTPHTTGPTETCVQPHRDMCPAPPRHVSSPTETCVQPHHMSPKAVKMVVEGTSSVIFAGAPLKAETGNVLVAVGIKLIAAYGL